MKRLTALTGAILGLVAIVAVVLAITAGSDTKGAATAASTRATSGYGTAVTPQRTAGTTIAVRTSSLGRVLTDGNGRTLYLFEADEPNVSKLSRAGVAIWPPLAANGTPNVQGGALASKLRTITGANGKPQLSYDGHPLYYYVGDEKPGQTNGQGLDQFGAKWYVLSPSGQKIDND
jgi:predicted lipoprotein with Yx(FWY)xxD motif